MLGRVFSARFSADGQSFVAASSLNGRGEVSIFTMPADLSAPKEIEALRAKAPKQRTPEEEQRLKDFESKAGVRTAQTFVESSAVYTVAFHPSGKEIAAAGSDGKVRIIRAADGAISTEFASVPLEKKGAETNVARASIRAVAPETLAPDKPHAAANLACIEIQPREIRIERANDYVQMLVTARYQDGTSADITRSAKIELSSPVADVTPRGQLHPKNDGAAELRVSFGNKSASVPVVVKGSTSRFAADFVRDVNPVMTKLGCNQGTCHGSKEGKGGFKLSLRGYDPEYDLRSLTDDMASRRVAVASPDDSLMLLKAVAEVPHEGGRRTHVDEKYYHILRQWIADGAPLDTQSVRPSKIELSPQNPVIQEIGSRQQFRVIAHFPDGSQRDVSNEAFLESGNTDVAAVDGNGLLSTLRRGEAPILARYEGNYIATTVTVMGDRTGFQWKEPVTWTRADELVAAKWKRMQIEPSDVCTDGEFLRRIYLDLTGLPPSAEQLRTFLADPRESRVKRESVVDTLVGSPDFVEHWTNKWSDLLQVNSKFLGKQGAEGFRAWIRTQLEKNTPYDQFAKAILTAEGSNKDNPAASYWKILRQPTEAMENTTHLFLATRFNCNKCHDHPFERWTQDQYYQTAAYFAQFTLAEDPASAGAKIGGTAVEGAKPLFEIVKENPQGQIKHDRTGKLTPPEFPYPAKAEIEEKANRRTQLAQWMTSPDNRYFASSYVNRIWGYLLGRGIIEPLDDIRAGNPPTNPELLEHLTQEFIRSGFDTRSVFKTICKSRTYQLSIRTNQWNEDDSVNYSHAIARRLPAETLFDSVFKVTGATATLPGMSAGGRAAMLVESSSDGAGGFLATLGRPTRESTCECERNSNLGLGSVMALLSGPTISSAIQDPKNELARLVSKQPDDSVLVNELFERVLSRSATPRELEATMKLMGTIDTDHKQVSEALAQKEKEQAPIIAAMEKERVSAIAKAKLNLENYEAATKNLREERESVRKDRQARADLALKAWEAALPTRVAGWLALSKPETLPVRWTKLQPKSAATTGAGLKLAIEKDGTLIASGNPARTDYNLSFETPVEGITAVVLEILPDPASPQFGPGRGKNGSFVLNEFTLQAGSPAAKQPLKSARIAKAWASSEQQKMGIALAIDGKEDEPQNGWSIANTPGQRHFAVFQLEKPLAFGAPTSLNVRLTHRSADGIGRFRIHVTTAENPLGEGIPAEVAAAAERASSERSAEEKATLEAYVRLTDAEHWRLSRELAEAKVPLNPDTLHTELQSVLAKASEPIRLDPKLVQLRIDAAASTQQVANKRLTVVQDLTWALINNPAFLFNR
jgi:hypothetical protein